MIVVRFVFTVFRSHVLGVSGEVFFEVMKIGTGMLNWYSEFLIGGFEVRVRDAGCEFSFFS